MLLSDKERDALRRIKDADLLDRMGTKDEPIITDEDEMDEEEYTDEDDYISDDEPTIYDSKAKKIIRSLTPKFLRKKKKKSAAPLTASQATVEAWGGWIMPYLREMYVRKTLILPLKGIYRISPEVNFSGYRAPSWDAFWSQLIQSLDSGSGRTLKEANKAIAAAGSATNPKLSANVRSIGLLVRISDSILQATNEPVQVKHFTGVGQTECDYRLGVNMTEGLAEYIILHPEIDRGSGIVTALPSLELTIPDGELRDGVRVTVESINYKEIQA